MKANDPVVEGLNGATPLNAGHPPCARRSKMGLLRAPYLHAHECKATVSVDDDDPLPFPRTVAHRGYKAKFPENTMSAFINAIRVGAHGLETDIHLSNDGVVVLSHDATLKRCFGINKRVVDCDWVYLSKLRTTKAPHEPMPTLTDLLEFMALPEHADVWVLLDIKLDNDLVRVMQRIAETIRSVPSPYRPWSERVVLGCWTSDYLPLCHAYLPSFPISIITFSLQYARLFLRIPNVSININKNVLMGPGGKKFLADAKRAQRQVFVWTVNDENLMRWSIERNVDAVLTDDPALFQKVCDDWEESSDLNQPLAGRSSEVQILVVQRIKILMIATLAFVISGVFMLIYRRRIRKFVRDCPHYYREAA